VTLVDTNVLVDILTGQPMWRAWSVETMDRQSASGALLITDVVYAELSPLFATAELLDAAIADLDVSLKRIPPLALFTAGRAFEQYRRKGGPRSTLLADFFIGAHALVEGLPILTRDTRRYRTYFPDVQLIAPDT
jgi:predicted nucleic acid-binding protein